MKSPRELSTPTVTIEHPAPRHRVVSTAPQPFPVETPSPVPAASTVGGSASGLGGIFFFGVAALLAFAGLVHSPMTSVLRRTADAAAPQPFLALLERPG